MVEMGRGGFRRFVGRHAWIRLHWRFARGRGPLGIPLSTHTLGLSALPGRPSRTFKEVLRI